MGKFKENWVMIIFTMALSIVGSLIVSSYNSTSSKIDEAASIEYVDSQDGKIIGRMTREDNKLQNQIDKKASSDEVEEIQKTLKVIDSRIYDLWKTRYDGDKN